MKLKINNKTPYVNEYFFQMLCLLYFPGEKFPLGEDISRNSAYFSLEEKDGGIKASCVVKSGGETGEAESFLLPSDTISGTELRETAEIAAGSAFIKACKSIFGFEPPWGILTGIRPAKRARNYFSKGYDAEKIIKILNSDFLIAEKKAKLCVETAKRQNKILSGYGEKDCSLYISIPFCPSRCSYCSFVSYSSAKLLGLIPDYLEKLQLDIADTASLLVELGLKVKTVYIGGGTPTILSSEQLKKLLGCVTDNFKMENVDEFTLEAGRPDTITAEKIEAAVSFGVTRMSVNPQTLDFRVLENIGRAHMTEDFFRAYELTASSGIVVNTDLIAGLPGDTGESFAKTLDAILAMTKKPDNITIHTLSLKNASLLRIENLNNDKIHDPEGVTADKCVDYATIKLGEYGYFPYYLYRQKNTVGNGENCGYALAGKECRYNILTMEDDSSVFACGAAALTKIVKGSEIKRFAFPKYPYEYLQRNRGIFEGEIKQFLNTKSKF